jgi:alkanesulfonate monooxygenase SsuD/methylene tetrahydromethanopterin reductase-like flavin-dependent oxidoreductase (luciferase family)
MDFGMPWPGAVVAREVEQAGTAAFCTGDFADHDAYVSLTQMVAGTTQAKVGTAIAYAFSRTPFAHASAVRALSHDAGERMFIGLGSAAFRINRDWFGVPAERPVARLTELVEVLRAFLHAENGQPITYTGEFYNINADVRAPVLGRLDVPILLAAVNRSMATAVGKVADGIIGHGLTTTRWWNEVLRPAVAAGAQSRERATPPLEYGWVITAIDDAAPERAIRDARLMIAFYLTVKTYDPMVAHHGWDAEVAALRIAFRNGDMDAMAGAVSDDMLNSIALTGTTADAIETLHSRVGGLPSDIGFFSTPSFMVGFRRREAYARASVGLIDAVRELPTAPLLAGGAR